MNSLWLIISFVCFIQSEHNLPSCPDSPNCVNSYQEGDDFEKMPPLAYTGSAIEALDKLESLIKAMPRTEITERDGLYMKSVFTIALFGFKDDVEFLADTSRMVIDFRSASRAGYYDFGVNRNRMESITEAWNDLSVK